MSDLNLDSYTYEETPYTEAEEKRIAPKTIDDVVGIKKQESSKLRSFNLLLANKNKHGRTKLVSPFKNVYVKHKFEQTDLYDRRVIGTFSIEPYILLHSLSTYKSIKGKKVELKKVCEKIEQAIGVKPKVKYQTGAYDMEYIFFELKIGNKTLNILYEDETCFEKVDDKVIKNLRGLAPYSKRLNYKRLNTPYAKFYIQTMISKFLGEELM